MRLQLAVAPAVCYDQNGAGCRGRSGPRHGFCARCRTEASRVARPVRKRMPTAWSSSAPPCAQRGSRRGELDEIAESFGSARLSRRAGARGWGSLAGRTLRAGLPARLTPTISGSIRHRSLPGSRPRGAPSLLPSPRCRELPRRGAGRRSPCSLALVLLLGGIYGGYRLIGGGRIAADRDRGLAARTAARASNGARHLRCRRP